MLIMQSEEILLFDWVQTAVLPEVQLPWLLSGADHRLCGLVILSAEPGF